ncbi:hypothetical protein AVEN_157196-1 [Araneus ventricosus]|uniref:Uncharacterized protein n=1 Tax=Araneus ventricosus TaxID=182803 RepID=A0A4Y2EEC9_ARAVE|nr:hypothetical protein AVEN_157196-1 [Araneus ventricosus]
MLYLEPADLSSRREDFGTRPIHTPFQNYSPYKEECFCSDLTGYELQGLYKDSILYLKLQDLLPGREDFGTSTIWPLKVLITHPISKLLTVQEGLFCPDLTDYALMGLKEDSMFYLESADLKIRKGRIWYQANRSP